MESYKRQRRSPLSSAQVVANVPITLMTVELHREVVPGAQCVCIRGYICRSPLPACQYTEGVPPPRAAERREECDCLRQLSGQYFVIRYLFICAHLFVIGRSFILCIVRLLIFCSPSHSDPEDCQPLPSHYCFVAGDQTEPPEGRHNTPRMRTNYLYRAHHYHSHGGN